MIRSHCWDLSFTAHHRLCLLVCFKSCLQESQGAQWPRATSDLGTSWSKEIPPRTEKMCKAWKRPVTSELAFTDQSLLLSTLPCVRVAHLTLTVTVRKALPLPPFTDKKLKYREGREIICPSHTATNRMTTV
jgi:hypothetical protein